MLRELGWCGLSKCFKPGGRHGTCAWVGLVACCGVRCAEHQGSRLTARGVLQHAKDRGYITATEWAVEWGGAKSKVRKQTLSRWRRLSSSCAAADARGAGLQSHAKFQQLPFFCCALTFTYAAPTPPKPLAACGVYSRGEGTV